MFQLVIDESLDGQRLDLSLVAAGAGLSRRKIREIIDAGGAYINNQRVRIASRTVCRGDKVRIEYSLETLRKLKHFHFEFQDKDILYLDDDLIAVNKPPGLPSQPTKDQSVEHVQSCVEHYLRTKELSFNRTYLVHRLDKETSGIILIALNETSCDRLMKQFRSREVKKIYHAICYGIPKKLHFTEQCYLSSIHKKLGVVRKVKGGGNLSITEFNLLKTNEPLQLSLIECLPLTGRSHQIRVHLELQGYPIVGDKRYGKPQKLPNDLKKLSDEHHFLHAKEIWFKGIDGKSIKIEAWYPENFQKFYQEVF